MSLFLSRAMLKRDPQIDALAAQLLPGEGGPRAHAAHRLVWSLFAGKPEGERDFLFRETAPQAGLRRRASLMILSRRPPRADSPFLDVETKEFAPALAAGDRLRFSLRANATVARKKTDKTGQLKAARSDLVMHALHPLPKADRAEAREAIVTAQACRWLAAQGEKAGFRLAGDDDEEAPAFRVDAYDVWSFPRLGPKGRIAVFDCEGLIEVTDPILFLDRLATGFGRARGFGCGLMLIRRA